MIGVGRDGRPLPIIAMTVNAFAEDRERARESGMDDFPAKSVRLETRRVYDSRAAAALAAHSGRTNVDDRMFWRRAAGCWAGESSYFDGEMAPIVPAYGNVLQIAVDAAGQFSLHEWKQYPSSELARNAAGGKLPEGEGFEVASVQHGRLDAQGVLELGTQGRYLPLDDHSAVRDLRDPETGVPRYRTWYTMPADDVLATTNLGIWYTAFESDYYNRPLRDPVSGETRPNARLGQLKGISVFRYRRIQPVELEAARAERRARFGIRAPAATSPPAPVKRR